MKRIIGSSMLGYLRVWLTAAVSSVVLSAGAQAHEVTPSIADLTVIEGQATLDIRDAAVVANQKVAAE